MENRSGWRLLDATANRGNAKRRRFAEWLTQSAFALQIFKNTVFSFSIGLALFKTKY